MIGFTPEPGSIFYFNFDEYLHPAPDSMPKTRPVVVLRVLNKNRVLIVPLSTQATRDPDREPDVTVHWERGKVSFAKLGLLESVPIRRLERVRHPYPTRGTYVPHLPMAEFLELNKVFNVLCSLSPAPADPS